MQNILRIFLRFFRRRSASAPVGSGCGSRTTLSTANTDAQRRREKERLMGGVL